MATHTERERLEQVLRGQLEFLDEVHALLEEEQKQDDIRRAIVLTSRRERITRITDPEPERIFDEAIIRDLCIKYRLRFLDAGLYKGELPAQAVHAIRLLERRSDGPLHSFKMMAPAEMFRLCDSEVDPLLFAPLGGGRYYLVHRWGKDLNAARIVLGWPTRSPWTLGACVLLMALVLSAVVPTHLITTDPQAGFWGAHRLLFLLWSTMVMSSFTVFAWFAFFGQFSTQAWNSRYFN